MNFQQLPKGSLRFSSAFQPKVKKTETPNPRLNLEFKGHLLQKSQNVSPPNFFARKPFQFRLTDELSLEEELKKLPPNVAKFFRAAIESSKDSCKGTGSVVAIVSPEYILNTPFILQNHFQQHRTFFDEYFQAELENVETLMENIKQPNGIRDLSTRKRELLESEKTRWNTLKQEFQTIFEEQEETIKQKFDILPLLEGFREKNDFRSFLKELIQRIEDVQPTLPKPSELFKSIKETKTQIMEARNEYIQSINAGLPALLAMPDIDVKLIQSYLTFEQNYLQGLILELQTKFQEYKTTKEQDEEIRTRLREALDKTVKKFGERYSEIGNLQKELEETRQTLEECRKQAVSTPIPQDATEADLRKALEKLENTPSNLDETRKLTLRVKELEDEIQKLKVDGDNMRQIIETQLEELNQQKIKLELQKEYSDAQNVVEQQKQAQLEEVQRQLQDKSKKVQELENQLSAQSSKEQTQPTQDEKVRQLEQKVADSLAQIELLKLQIENYKTITETNNDRNDKLEERIQLFKLEKQNLEKQLEDSLSSQEQLNIQIEKTRTLIKQKLPADIPPDDDVEAMLNAVFKKLSVLKTQLETLDQLSKQSGSKRSDKDLEKQVAELTKKLKNAEEKLKSQSVQEPSFQETLAKQKLQNLQLENKTLKDQLASQETKINQERMEREKKESELKALKSNVESVYGLLDTVKGEALQNIDFLNRIYTTIKPLLQQS